MNTESGHESPSEHQAEAERPTPKVIKRYSNRKLYDTDRSKYVTLDEIAKMIKAGEEITIIDNESKEDLTSVTLTQIIYEEEKRESRMPLGMLRNLIQTGGSSLQDFFDRQVKTPAMDFQKNVEKSVEKSYEEIVQSAASIREAATRGVTGLTDSARRMFNWDERRAEEFKKSITTLADQLETKVDERIAEITSRLQDPPLTPKGEPAQAEELEQAHRARAERLAVDAHAELLRARIAALQAKVDALETAGNAPPQQAAPSDAAAPEAPAADASAEPAGEG